MKLAGRSQDSLAMYGELAGSAACDRGAEYGGGMGVNGKEKEEAVEKRERGKREGRARRRAAGRG